MSCWILQDAAAGTPHKRPYRPVEHFPSREQAADHSRRWAPGTTPVQLSYRCHLLECVCDAPDVCDEGCISPDHDTDSCESLAHGRDEDDAIARALEDSWEEATTDPEGRPLLMCDSCA